MARAHGWVRPRVPASFEIAVEWRRSARRLNRSAFIAQHIEHPASRHSIRREKNLSSPLRLGLLLHQPSPAPPWRRHGTRLQPSSIHVTIFAASRKSAIGARADKGARSILIAQGAYRASNPYGDAVRPSLCWDRFRRRIGNAPRDGAPARAGAYVTMGAMSAARRHRHRFAPSSVSACQ
jgi:hypothetical protein